MPVPIQVCLPCTDLSFWLLKLEPLETYLIMLQISAVRE